MIFFFFDIVPGTSGIMKTKVFFFIRGVQQILIVVGEFETLGDFGINDGIKGGGRETTKT